MADDIKDLETDIKELKGKIEDQKTEIMDLEAKGKDVSTKNILLGSMNEMLASLYKGLSVEMNLATELKKTESKKRDKPADNSTTDNGTSSPPSKKRRVILTLEQLAKDNGVNCHGVTRTVLDDGWIKYESVALPEGGFEFFPREVHDELKTAMAKDDEALLTGTPGSGKTLTIRLWMMEKTINNERAVLVVGRGIFCCDEGKLVWIFAHKPIDVLEAFVDDKTTVYLDAPQVLDTGSGLEMNSKKLEFFNDVITPARGLKPPPHQIIVSSSPDPYIVYNYQCFTNEGYARAPIYLMKMWDDDEFSSFLKHSKKRKIEEMSIEMPEQTMKDFMTMDDPVFKEYGFLPRVALCTEDGRGGYQSSFDNLMKDFPEFREKFLRKLPMLKENKLGLMDLPHHVFQLKPTSVKYEVDSPIPVHVPEGFWKKILDMVNKQEQSSGSIELLSNVVNCKRSQQRI
eukprot:TRINITY_DN46_c0_g2_i1.p1 TRINITY_DN46_c0_g2~~TRINITY_DN46_c0_g2_i1.p1  ORF type:complete len:457 (+),score=120.30 TRINITY_DN46_c0_g2_i1:80-1450(+)